MASHDVELLPYQLEVLNDTDTKEIFMAMGIGCGKSFTLALWIIHNVYKYPGCKGLLVANTYTQLINATLQELITVLDQFDIPYTKVLSGAKKHIKINKSIVYLYSLEKYDNIRGITVDFIGGDEIAFSKYEAYQTIKGRLRGNKGLLRCLWTSTTNGLNWCWEKFGNKDGILATNKRRLIRAATHENTFLPDGYYTDLLEEYGGEDSPLARQELFGEFVSLQGSGIYWAFDREKNVKECALDKRYPVYVGMDFNMDNMNAVLMQYIRGKFYLCDRIFLEHGNANTYDMAERLVRDYSEYTLKIIPDSTGSSRKTSAIAGQSDHQILRDAGLEVLATKNPLIRNRQNNVNMKFKKDLLYIHPKLTKLIAEVETLAARDKEGDVSHAAVSMGYVLWLLDPLKRVVKSRESFSTSF